VANLTAYPPNGYSRIATGQGLGRAVQECASTRSARRPYLFGEYAVREYLFSEYAVREYLFSEYAVREYPFSEYAVPAACRGGIRW